METSRTNLQNKYHLDTNPNVLNLFMLGTNEHFESCETVLTSLFASLPINDKHSKYIINGPGGESPHKETEHPVLGTYDAESVYDPETGLIKTIKKPRTPYDPTARLKGLALGYGYKDAYKEALDVIDKMIRAGKKPLRINMYGFSRGADTLLRICNLLNVLYPNGEVEINFLAIDTVPGPGRQDAKKARTVPPIVKRYECVYMKHERRREFALQDKTSLIVEDLNKTEVINHIVSGTHSHPERFILDPYNAENKGTDAGKILWEITHRFARACGSLIPSFIPYVRKVKSGEYEKYKTETPSLSDEEYLNCYTRMINDDDYYHRLNRSVGVADRPFVQRKRDYFLHGHEVFQDLTHIKLFKKLYPNLFDYYFQKNKQNSAVNSVKEDILKLKQNPLLYTYIKKFVPQIEALDLGEPQGIPIIVEDFYHKGNSLWHLWESLQSMLFGIIAGHEKSISPAEANKILEDVYEIIIQDIPESSKIEKIQKKIRENIAIYIESDIAKKLVTLLPGNENPLKVIIVYLESREKEGAYDSLSLYLGNRFKKIQEIMNSEDNISHKEKEKKIEEELENLLQDVSKIDVDENNKEGNQISNTEKHIFHSKQTKETVLKYLRIVKNQHGLLDGAKEIFTQYIIQQQLLEKNHSNKINEKIMLIAELTKSYLEILSVLGAQKDTAAIGHILTSAQSQIKGLCPTHPLVGKLKEYLFTLGTNVVSKHENSEQVSELIEKYDLALNNILYPEKALFQTRLKQILAPLTSYKTTDQQSKIICEETQKSLEKLAILVHEIPAEDIKTILGVGCKAAKRVNDGNLEKAFQEALSILSPELSAAPSAKVDNVKLRLIGRKIVQYRHTIEAVAPYPLLEQSIILLERFLADESYKERDQMLTVANHCLRALVQLRDQKDENNKVFSEILTMTRNSLSDDMDELDILLRNIQRSIPREEHEAKIDEDAQKILDELKKKLSDVKITFVFPFGKTKDIEDILTVSHEFLPERLTWNYIKERLKEKLKTKYTNNEVVLDQYLNNLKLFQDNTEIPLTNDLPLGLDKNKPITLSYQPPVNEKKRDTYYSDIVKLEQALKSKTCADIAYDFMSFARRRLKLKPKDRLMLDNVINKFPNALYNFNLKERLQSLENNKYKISLYRKLHKLGKAISRMDQEEHVDKKIKTAYKDLYDKLLRDIHTSTATSSTYDPLPVVMDHFTNLAVPICKRKKKPITVSEMTRSMERLDKKLTPKKPIHPGLKGLICGVIGAIVGVSVGIVVGAAVTCWGGGFGALPGAIAGGVAGFSIGVAVGAGVGGGVGAMAAAGFGIFKNHKNRKIYEDQKDNNHAYKGFVKNTFGSNNN